MGGEREDPMCLSPLKVHSTGALTPCKPPLQACLCPAVASRQTRQGFPCPLTPGIDLPDKETSRSLQLSLASPLGYWGLHLLWLGAVSDGSAPPPPRGIRASSVADPICKTPMQNSEAFRPGLARHFPTAGNPLYNAQAFPGHQTSLVSLRETLQEMNWHLKGGKATQTCRRRYGLGYS